MSQEICTFVVPNGQLPLTTTVAAIPSVAVAATPSAITNTKKKKIIINTTIHIKKRL